MDPSSLQTMVAELEHLRRSCVILYIGQDRGQFPHQIGEDDALPLYQ
jgi:hypothetical protein